MKNRLATTIRANSIAISSVITCLTIFMVVFSHQALIKGNPTANRMDETGAEEGILIRKNKATGQGNLKPILSPQLKYQKGQSFLIIEDSVQLATQGGLWEN